MKRRVGRIGLVMVLATVARQAHAQLGCLGSTCTIEITMPVSDVLRLSLSTSSISLGTPIESDFQAGYRDVTGAAINVTAKSNRPFSVQLSGVTPAFSYSGTLPAPGKPASDLLWATSAAALSTTANTIGTTTTFLNQGAGAITSPLFLRTLWSFVNDVPGTYSLTIRFTLSAP
jgi:hypothetical protein